jgi:tetratricopeptide (TPR) repeat protein
VVVNRPSKRVSHWPLPPREVPYDHPWGRAARRVRRIAVVAFDRLRERRHEWLFDRLGAADSWAAAQRLVDRHPVLLDPAVDQLVEELADTAEEIGEYDVADSYRYHQGLLRRCRAVGTAAAFRELTTDETDATLVDLANRAGEALRRYETGGNATDLDAALRDAQEAVGRAVAVPTRVSAQNTLGLALIARGDRDGRPDDVRRAVAVLEEAVTATPPRLPERRLFTVNHARALLQWYDIDGKDACLDRAVKLLSRASAESPPADAVERSAMLTNLGSALHTRFVRRGTAEDLDAAIATFARVPRSEKLSFARARGNLAVALADRYQLRGDERDLDAAIEAAERSVDLTPAESPEAPARRAHLAGLLVDRHDRLGSPQDLRLAVEQFTLAADTTPATSPERATRDGDLGTVLLAVYQSTGDLTDLDLSVAAHRRAVEAPIYERGDRAVRLDQLGTSLRTRARRTGDAAEAAEAVAVHDRAVALTGATAPEHVAALNNLAGALRLLAELAQDRAALRRAVATYAEALALVRPDTPRGRAVLANLGIGMLDQATTSGDSAELDRAIEVLGRAVADTEPDSPEVAGRLCNLAHGLRARHDRTGNAEDLAAAVTAYRRSCVLAEAGSQEVRMAAARAWGMWACARARHTEAVEAFGHAADAMERLVRTQSTRAFVETWLSALAEIPAHAAHEQVAVGDVHAAALSLEQGRARTASSALERDRADLTALEAARPDLADRFRRAAHRVSAHETAEFTFVPPDPAQAGAQSP